MNLDAMSADDLTAFGLRYQGGKKARELFPCGWRRQVHVARELANYASNKAIAMRHRANGDTVTARTYELMCDRIYNALPAHVQWDLATSDPARTTGGRE